MLTMLSWVAAHAGGWTQPAGEHYLKAGYRAVPGWPLYEGFGLKGERVPLRPYGDHALQAYGELGLTDTWTAVVDTTLVGLAAYGGERAVYTGPTRLGLRRALTTGRVRTAVEVQAGGTLPVGTRDLAPERDVAWQPAVGTAAVSGALQVGVGFGRTWVSADVGFLARSHLSEVVFGTVQVGRSWEHLVLDLHVPVAWALSPMEAPLNYMGSTNTRYVGAGIGVGWWFTERFGLATGIEGAPFAVANARSATLPLYVQLR